MATRIKKKGAKARAYDTLLAVPPVPEQTAKRRKQRELMANPPKGGLMDQPMGPPQSRTESYADQIIAEARRGRRPANDPDVKAAERVRIPSDKAKKLIQNQPTMELDGQTVTVDYYLKYRERQRAQEKANKTGKPVSMKGRGGKWGAGNELLEWISPQKHGDETISGTPISKEQGQEYRKKLAPYKKELTDIRTELRTVKRRTRQLGSKGKLSKAEQKEMSKLKTKQSELAVRRTQADKNIQSVTKSTDESAGPGGDFKKTSMFSPGSVQGTRWDPDYQGEDDTPSRSFSGRRAIARERKDAAYSEDVDEFLATGNPATAAKLLKAGRGMSSGDRRRLIEATTPKAWAQWDRRQSAKGRFQIALSEAMTKADKEMDRARAGEAIREVILSLPDLVANPSDGPSVKRAKGEINGLRKVLEKHQGDPTEIAKRIDMLVKRLPDEAKSQKTWGLGVSAKELQEAAMDAIGESTYGEPVEFEEPGRFWGTNTSDRPRSEQEQIEQLEQDFEQYAIPHRARGVPEHVIRSFWDSEVLSTPGAADVWQRYMQQQNEMADAKQGQPAGKPAPTAVSTAAPVTGHLVDEKADPAQTTPPRDVAAVPPEELAASMPEQLFQEFGTTGAVVAVLRTAGGTSGQKLVLATTVNLIQTKGVNAAIKEMRPSGFYEKDLDRLMTILKVGGFMAPISGLDG